jgi:hypothetical protein
VYYACPSLPISIKYKQEGVRIRVNTCAVLQCLSLGAVSQGPSKALFRCLIKRKSRITNLQAHSSNIFFHPSNFLHL